MATYALVCKLESWQWWKKQKREKIKHEEQLPLTADYLTTQAAW